MSTQKFKYSLTRYASRRPVCLNPGVRKSGAEPICEVIAIVRLTRNSASASLAQSRRYIHNSGELEGSRNTRLTYAVAGDSSVVDLLLDVVKVLGLISFSLACTLLAHAIANGLSPETDRPVLFDQEVPQDWNVQEYNSDKNTPRIFAWLEQVGAKTVKIPYRTNRPVIFNSDLFHETDEIAFRDDYLSRPINMALLYGSRIQA